MTDETSAAVGKQHSYSKFLKKDKWRSKVAALTAPKEQSNPPVPDQSADIADFLRPSTNRTRPISPKTPRIDIAAAQRAPATEALATPSIMRKSEYPRRTLNLRVAFTNAPPAIIGEGGEEAEAPTIEISRERAPHQGPAPTLQRGSTDFDSIRQNQGRGFGEPGPAFPGPIRSIEDPRPESQDNVDEHPHRHSSFPTEEPNFVPNPIKRAPTLFANVNEQEYVRPSMDSADSERSQESLGAAPTSGGVSLSGTGQNFRLPEFNSAMDSSPIELTSRFGDVHIASRQNTLDSPVLQEKIHKMREEEGKALHAAAHENPFEDRGVESNRLSSSTSSSFQTQSPLDTQKPFPSPGAQNVSQLRSSFTNTYLNDPPSSQLPTPSPLGSFPTPGYPTPGIQPNRGPSMRKPLPSQLAADPQLMSSQVSGSRPSPLLNLNIPNNPDYFGASPRAVEHPPVSRKEVQPQPEPFSAASSVASKIPYSPHAATNARPPSNAIPSAAFSQMALEDFADRCSHMDGIFRLQAEFERPINDFTPSQWLRNSAWWFLKGRAGIETMVRNLPRGPDGRPESRQGETLLSQPHVDLAKCWWVLNDVIVNHPAVGLQGASEFIQRSSEARAAGDNLTAELFESADILMANLKAVLSSMKRNNVMPPTHALIQGQDQTVWVRYPNLAPNLLPILSGNMSRSLTDSGTIQTFSPLSVMAVGETRNDFCYNSMFVKAFLGTNDENSERISLPCLVSVMRERNDWHQKLAICTQREIITLCIQGDSKRGPSWNDVKWNEQSSGLLVQLPHGYSLSVQLSEPDFKQLYQMYNQNYRVQSSLLPHSDEQVVYEVSLRDFQYTDSNKPPAFPPERVKRCRLRIFAKIETRVEGAGERKFYRGFRLLAVTSPKNRILGSASHDLGFRYPILLAMASDQTNEGAPAMTLQVQELRRQCTLLMVFNHPKDCHGLWNTLNSSNVGPEEMQVASIRLEHIAVEQSEQTEAYSPASRNPLGRLTWQELIVINGDPTNPDHDGGQTVLSNHLRIISQAGGGTVTDRVNVGPGEMLVRLRTDGKPELAICRPPQDDLSMSLDSASPDPFMPKELSDVQRTFFMHSSIRTYSFFTLEDLHVFEKAITGFIVKYDGLAATFAVARRRPVTALSKHKKIEATRTRIQIVSHENHKMIQLLAFFDDLPQADALNFQLKGMDVFERCEGKSGKAKYGVKMVDVKFTLPKVDKEERASTPDGKGRIERKFVSLDMLEPPAENDDIVIGFDDEQEREKFLAALPAPPQVSRGLTLKRRI